MEHLLAPAYEKVAPIFGEGVESLAVIRLVAAHRSYWRPRTTRVLLLAESHVYTRDSECVPMQGVGLPDMAGAPETYVRLVYCLGYGESKYVGSKVKPNPGTPQFWKIFASCVSPPGESTFSPVLRGRTPDFRTRLEAKVRILRQMQAAGVWLLDASLLALCRPGGARLDPATCEGILRTSWQHYVGEQVRALNPESIIVIGKGVARALKRELAGLGHGKVTVLPQPQAHLPAAEARAVFQQYFEICQG
jgi:hypothetical protein